MKVAERVKMSDINTVTISGRLGNDPDFKYFESGAKCVTISIGVNKWSKKQEKEVVTWHTAKAWGNKAEFIGEVAKKGVLVCIQGTLEKDVFKDEQTGKNIAKTYILINEVKITNKKES